jgi:hypothetical protein
LLQVLRHTLLFIAKAVREGRHGRVKTLQWLLTRSFVGKALAVKRVVSNRGRKTPRGWSNLAHAKAKDGSSSGPASSQLSSPAITEGDQIGCFENQPIKKPATDLTGGRLLRHLSASVTIRGHQHYPGTEPQAV